MSRRHVVLAGLCLALAFEAWPAAAQLIGTKATGGTGTINLTAEGTDDWAHWGFNGTEIDHKSVSGKAVDHITAAYDGTLLQYADNLNGYSWTDGTPATNAMVTTKAIYIVGTGKGVTITVPADTTTRTLKLYVGGWMSTGKLAAHLSDNSAADYTDSSFHSKGVSYYAVYTITCKAGSANQSLSVKWQMLSGADGGNVTLQAATLRVGGDLTAPAQVDDSATTARPHRRMGESSRYQAGDEASIDLGGGVQMEFVWIPPGEFLMGSPSNEIGRTEGELQHKVILTKGFWMGKYEVTQQQWQQVMGDNPSLFKNPEQPVADVSWNVCQKFVKRMNETVRPSTGLGASDVFRLPAEAEWEYACRAGTAARFDTGDSVNDLNREGWYKGTSGGHAHPVGEAQANAWGLFDMRGNVSEWCQDWLGDYPAGVETDPTGPLSGECRVQRGGGFGESERACRSARRWGSPDEGGWWDGLRLVVGYPIRPKAIPKEVVSDPFDVMDRYTEAGEAQHQFDMGESYLNGTNKLFIKDNIEAIYWFSRAAEENNPSAKLKLGTIRKQKLVREEDMEIARWMLQAEPGAVFPATNRNSSVSSDMISNTEPPQQAARQAERKAGDVRVVYLGGGIRFEMVWIPAGEFMMAASKSMAQHNVKLTTGFWMGKYEVTQEQWKRIMGDNPTLFKGTRLPVGGLNWNHAHDFITKLNETVRSSRDIASSEEFRFPTEAEWEYACRAGKPAQFYAGNQDDDPDSICWHRDNSECRLHPVGEKKPNAWGLYDTYGNVNELCYDYETEGTWPAAPAVDPTGPSRADGCKIARGGDGRTSWDFCLVERDISMPWWPRIFTGLRLAFGKPIVQP